MDKVQSVDEIKSVLEANKQKKDPGKCEREAQEVGYAVKEYWIKQKKKVKVNGVEKEIAMIKYLGFFPDDPLSEDHNTTKDTWGFVIFQLHWTFYQSKRRNLMPMFYQCQLLGLELPIIMIPIYM